MAAAKLAGSLLGIVKEAALPAGALGALGLFTGGPVDALKYGITDLAVNVPAIALARRIAPGSKGVVSILNKKGVPTGKVRPTYTPSNLELGANLTASMFSSVIADQLFGPSRIMPTDMSQEQQLYSQAKQRQLENNLQTQALAPGTQFQMQGLPARLTEQLGVEAPIELREYLREVTGYGA